MFQVIQQGKVTSNTVNYVVSKQLLYPIKNGHCLVILELLSF